MPAIQQLYSLLLQGLQGEQQVGNQNILENASGRGLLRSTIPVDAQAGLGQQILQKQGQYAAQQGQDLANIYQQIGQLRTQKAQDVTGLAGKLQQTALAKKQFQYQKQQAARQYQLDLQAARNF